MNSELNAEMMVERQKLTAMGMAQFEAYHAPVTSESGEITCTHCDEDFPCSRMTTMLIVQGMAMLQSMIPSGNMGAILGRFGGGGR